MWRPLITTHGLPRESAFRCDEDVMLVMRRHATTWNPTTRPGEDSRWTEWTFSPFTGGIPSQPCGTLSLVARKWRHWNARNQNIPIAPTQTMIPLASKHVVYFLFTSRAAAVSLLFGGGRRDGGCRLRTTKRKDARTFVVEQQKMHADRNLFGLFYGGWGGGRPSSSLRVIRLGAIIIIQICKLLVYALPQSQW